MRHPVISNDLRDIVEDGTIPWHQLKGSSILVTGGTGFLPRYLIESLLLLNEEKNYEIQIYALCRNQEKANQIFKNSLKRSDLFLIHADFSSPLPPLPPMNFIIHAASPASPKVYGVDPIGTLKPNVLGTYALLEKAVEWRTKSFLYFSSGEVYGVVPDHLIPIQETSYGCVDPTQVRSCYAESKRMGENLCVSFHYQKAVPAKIVRPFHTYGPGLSLEDGRVFADFVSNIIKKENIVIKSDGRARRPYCYISDAIRAFFLVLLKGENAQAYNVGNPEMEVSVLELAQRLVALFPEWKLELHHEGRQEKTNYLESPIARNSPDIKKIASLGWHPRCSIEEGFKRTVASFFESSEAQRLLEGTK